MLFKKLSYFISVLISIYLFFKIGNNIFIDVSDIDISFKNLNLAIFILIIFIPIFFLLSLKLVLLLNHVKKIKLYDSFMATIIAYNYNLFFPAKTGDFFRHKFLNFNIGFKNFFRINVIEKLVSLIVLFFFVLISYFLLNLNFSTLLNFNIVHLYLLIFIIFVSIILLLLFFLKKEKVIKKKIYNFFILDIIIWSLQFAQIFLIIKILDININLIEIIFIFGVSIIMGLVPISVGGFGVRDYVIFIFFEFLKIEANLFLLLILFNLRYLIPVFFSLLFSFSQLGKKESN